MDPLQIYIRFLMNRKRRDLSSSSLNPKNWGVKNYDGAGDFSSAYSSAKKEGESFFIYKGKRYNTSYGGTPRQEAGSYGVGGSPVSPNDLESTAQINKYPIGGNYIPGHVSASIDNNTKSIDYSSLGNSFDGISPARASKGEKSYNLYGIDKEKFIEKWESLPVDAMGSMVHGIEMKKSDWDLLTNNCADNVAEALDIPKSKFITTPGGVVNKAIKKYQGQEITGRTIEDYKRLSKSVLDKSTSDPDAVLKEANNLLGISYSPDMIKNGVSKDIITALQSALKKKGYPLKNSTLDPSVSRYGSQDRETDGVLGPETLQAIKDYQSRSSK